MRMNLLLPILYLLAGFFAYFLVGAFIVSLAYGEKAWDDSFESDLHPFVAMLWPILVVGLIVGLAICLLFKGAYRAGQSLHQCYDRIARILS
jgi:formate-dependent nitrite reductase membrane component NrfD